MAYIVPIPARTRQLLLMASVLALIVGGLLAGAHACTHAADTTGSRDQCAVCRHLDGNPVAFVAGWTTANVPAQVDLPPATAPEPVRRTVPACRSRSPPRIVAHS